MICTVFDEEGYDGTPLPIGPDTPDLIESILPDALMIDLVANHTRSWQLIQNIQANEATRETPRIITSTDARSLSLLQRDPEKYGGDRFMLKPFDVFELADVVRSLVTVCANGEQA
jgi:DNA-binding response OmpR family regulator